MLYVIKKGSKYYSSSGWVSIRQAMGTTSLYHAEEIARKHGGKPVPFK